MLFLRTLWNFLVRSLLPVVNLLLEMKLITFMLYLCMMYDDGKIAFISIKYHNIIDSLSLIRLIFFTFSSYVQCCACVHFLLVYTDVLLCANL
jgi:hypothetical protein